MQFCKSKRGDSLSHFSYTNCPFHCHIVLIHATLQFHYMITLGFQSNPKVCVTDHQGGSEPELNGLDNFYIPTSSLAICFSVLEDSGLSADLYFDMEWHFCPKPAAFLSWHTCIMLSTYVYTSFASGLVLAKSVVFGKMSRQTLLFNCLLYWLHTVWAHSSLRNWVHITY